MGFDDKYRLSAHAVITDAADNILLLKADYGAKGWGLSGGSLERGETVHQALVRECREEIGLDVEIDALTGVYYHSAYESHVFIFRCRVIAGQGAIQLSHEHTDYKFFPVLELSNVQKIRVLDALNFDGTVKSKSF